VPLEVLNAKIQPPVELKPLEQLPKNLSQLIKYGRRPPVPNFVQIPSLLSKMRIITCTHNCEKIYNNKN